jgi:hypothetical protein
MSRRSTLGLAATVTLGLLLALTLALAACHSQVSGNGVPGEVTRVVPPFDGVAISLGIEVIITVGTKDQLVTLSGDANLLQYIETAVDVHGVLVTSLNGMTGSIEPIIPLRLQLLVPPPVAGSGVGPFSSIEVAEESSVDLNRAAGAAADTLLTVDASDSSQVQLDGGSGDRLEVSLSGGSRLYAETYDAATAGFVVTGGSTIHVKAATLITSPQSSASGASKVELSGGARCSDVVRSADSTCVEK